MNNQKLETIVPDTSVIIEGVLNKKLEARELAVDVVMIHEAILAELEHQANMGKSIGFVGLDEIKKLKELAPVLGFKLEFVGQRPKAAEIRYAKLGEIDALIRQLAYESDATLMTADRVQARVAEAKGIKLLFVELEIKPKRVLLENFFDEATMSVHLREGMPPMAKLGRPGAWDFKAIAEKALDAEEIKAISREIVEEAGLRRDAFIEVDRAGSTIVQLGNYRTVIARPPFADGWEITAVRPIKTLALKDYNLSPKLAERIEKRAEGVLIAGAPGMGKTTFAQALAEHYAAKGKAVKTIEAPRDLILSDAITQFALRLAEPGELHDVLLLSRPDYTIFDEMHATEDFRLYADLRLAGIGMVGVVHATKPIDAIQRFIGRIEMGVIPHVVDTVIFIKDGIIAKVYSLDIAVKVPSGMTEADLARPVVVVADFESGKPEYEIYNYGEQTVVVPVKAMARPRGLAALAARALEAELRKYGEVGRIEFADENKATVWVEERAIPAIVGRKGENIAALERRLGIAIELRLAEDGRKRRR